MDLRDKDIEFFLELDIPSGSEDGFCESDDDIDGANNEYNFDELLQNNEDTEIFQQEIKETLDRWDAVQLDNDMYRQHTDTVEQNTDLYIFDTFPEPSFVPQRPTRSTATYQQQNYDINLSPPATELPVQPPNVPNINVHDSSVTSLEVPSITPVTAVPQITKVPCRTPITANNVRRNNVWTAGKDNLLADYMLIFSGNSETNINPKNETPYSYFTEIFTDEMFEHIRIETIWYAVENGNAAFTMCMNELKKYFVINIAMTYIKYPYVRMYWSSLPGMRQNMIADAMTSKRFSAIKSNLHFEDNSKKPNLNTPHDKYWKLRPIINLLHKSFHSAFDPEEHICVDEMIFPLKGEVA